MHTYAIDSNERKTTRLYLAAASILGAWFIHWLIQSISFTPPWWLELPSFLGLFGVFHTIFDKWFWRWPVVRKVGLSKMPVLNGTWQGQIISSFDGHKNQHKATVEIYQTWTQIKIFLRTAESESHSQTASIITEFPHKTHISYEYLNEPRADAKTTMHFHRGMARLSLCTKGDLLEGEYFTGRDRGTFGRVHLERKITP